MKLLHIIATPRGKESNTMRCTNAFLDLLLARYPDLTVDVIDLFNQGAPSIAGEKIGGRYTLALGKPIDKGNQEAWGQIEQMIEHFKSADIYLISTPMWNFNVPYALKYYIDCIIQPGYLFKYNEQGQVVPLVLNKKMICITSRGGDYSAQSPIHSFDFQEPYLRAIFGFVGITDIRFINAQPMDISPDLRESAIGAALEDVSRLVSASEWAA